jgi:hypothetical protein
MTAQIIEFPHRSQVGLILARRQFQRAEEFYQHVLHNFDATRPLNGILFRHAQRRREAARDRYINALMVR